MPRSLSRIGIFGVVLWAVAPLFIAAWAILSISHTELFPAKSVWVHPDPGAGDIDRPVGIQLHWSEPAEVFAPSWLGLVQKVHTQAGATIESGQVVVKVDGIDRIAFASTLPFARSLSLGNEGTDVRSLNSLLQLRGLPFSDSDRFTWDTRLGVRALAEELGVPSTVDRNQFDPAWVVYLPSPEFVVSTVTLQVGTPAPAAGTAIVTSTRTLSFATLVALGDIPPSAEESTVSETPLATQSAAEEETLVVGTAELPLDADRDRIAADVVSQLQGLVQPLAPFTRGVLRQTVPPDHYRIPVSAIISEKNGLMCVLKALETDEEGSVLRHEAVDITVVSSSGGVAWVTGDVNALDLIDAGPPAGDRACQPSH